MNSILGTKIGMSQVFVDGRRVPVTKILAGPCVVLAVEKAGDDSWLLQLGFSRFILSVKSGRDYKIGDQIKASDIFSEKDRVSVSGISKGKGFAGVVKRYHFKGGPRTHGQSDRERAPGSIGQTTTPGRVYKGKKMAGRMGGSRVTLKNLKILSIDSEKNEMSLSGPVPGIRKGLLIVNKI